MTAALAAITACHDVVLDNGRVVAIEVVTPAPRVNTGETLQLVARPINVAGETLSTVTVTWAVLDTGALGFTLSPAGLVTGINPDTARIQAEADGLRTPPITLTIVRPTP